MIRTTSRLPAAAAFVALVLASPVAADEGSLRQHVQFLASGELQGRLTGTPGERKAAEFLADHLAKLGLTPLPGQSEILLPFDFTAGSRDVGSSIRIASGSGAPENTEAGGERTWTDASQVQALSFSDTGTVSGPVIFAGYGLVVPESQDFGYDSYATLDVKDKVVVVLRYFPEDLDQEARSKLARYSGLRYKALAARERGARAVIVTTGPRSPNAGETIPMTFDTALSGSGIVAASVGAEVAQALFAAAGKDLEAVQRELDTGNPHVGGFDLEGVELTLDVRLERERRTGYNVAGVLPGGPDAAATAELERPYVLVGAHFDHLGRGRHGNSLARKGETGEIHFGADDNASGVAAVLEIVEGLRQRRHARHVAIVLWSGEELGLLGSSEFLKQEILPVDQIAAYVNFDMVGRVRDNKLAIQAADSSEAWPRLLEQSNVPVGLDLELQGDPYLPTDSAAFNLAKVPTLNFFSGSHEDYHRPTDTAATINYEDLERVARLGTLVVSKLANLDAPPQFVQVERRAGSEGSRDSVRAFTGTIPDYTTEVDGLRLSGVMEGGPADEAGLQEGDIIVQFGSQTIANIYDYTYALDAVKIDQPLTIIYERNGERHETTITPRARK